MHGQAFQLILETNTCDWGSMIHATVVRVAVNFWEVAFNDLKQFARVDSEKQGAQTWPLRNTLF